MKDTAHDLKSNIVYQSIYQLLSVATPLITAPYISRKLGAGNIGIYSYCYSVAYYFGIFAILGITTYGNREIAVAKTGEMSKVGRVFKEIFLMQCISSFASIALYLVYIALCGKSLKPYAVIELLYVLSCFFDISWFYFGMEDFRLTTIRSLIIKILSVTLILVFVKSPNSLLVYTFIMAGSALASSIVLWLPIRHYVMPESVSLHGVLSRFHGNIVLFIPVISLAIFHYMDKVMLGKYSTMEELGYYTNADKIVNIPMGLIGGLGIAMLPRVASCSAEGRLDKIKYYTEKSIIISSFFGMPMCFGIMAVSSEFVPVFFGPGYLRCVDILYIFSIVIIIKSISNVLRMQYLVPTGKDKEFNISVIAAAFVNIIANFILIPLFGAVGATIGTVIAEVTVLVLYYYFTLKTMKIENIKGKMLVFLLGSLIMYFFVKAMQRVISIHSPVLRVLMEITWGIIIYTAVIAVLYMCFYKADAMNICRNVFKGRDSRLF